MNVALAMTVSAVMLAAPPPSESPFRPADPEEWADLNQNGIGDNSDGNDTDEDDDGYNDLVDLKDSVDAGILIELKSSKVVDDVDLVTGLAEVYFDVRINGRQEARIDNLGYPYITEVGAFYYIGKSLRFNVDDNRRYTKISIAMWDEDYTSQDDLVDIDGVNLADKTLDIMRQGGELLRHSVEGVAHELLEALPRHLDHGSIVAGARDLC